MKTTTLLLAFILFIASINSCKDDKKEDTPTPVVVDTLVYFTCKLNNVAYVDDARFADYILGTTRIVSQNNDELVRIDFGAEATGTYVLDTLGANKMLYYDVVGVKYNAVSGSLTITKYDKLARKISGTFTASMKKEGGSSVIAVTEGKFNNIVLDPF